MAPREDTYESRSRERFLSGHPSTRTFHDPVAKGIDEVVVEVLAAGLHPRVRSQAGGFHYTSTGELPLIPGVDAVVRDPQGRIRYTIIVDDTTLGTMAERTVIELDRSVVLPDGTDPVVGGGGDEPSHVLVGGIAAADQLRSPATVVILGATGNAGRMAIQVAKSFGASRVIAAGRDTAKLAELTGARRR
jgi:NADPH:quinone reductase-like Zn-dependent oxidoreductase